MCLIQGMRLISTVLCTCVLSFGFCHCHFQTKVLESLLFFLFAVATGVPRPPAVTQSVGETATEIVMYCILPGESRFSPPEFSF